MNRACINLRLIWVDFIYNSSSNCNSKYTDITLIICLPRNRILRWTKIKFDKLATLKWILNFNWHLVQNITYFTELVIWLKHLDILNNLGFTNIISPIMQFFITSAYSNWLSWCFTRTENCQIKLLNSSKSLE